MEFFLRSVSLVLVVGTTLCQYEGFDGYEGLEGYHIKPPVTHHHHQSLDEHEAEQDLDYHAHPKYAFDYSVKDPHTGDNKEHWETRDGDKVKGTYTIYETDGTKRIVEYEADDKNGFNAVVHKVGTPVERPEEYRPKKPVYEPPAEHAYYHEYQLDGGFVPIAGHYHH